jgi:hypothetical protein
MRSGNGSVKNISVELKDDGNEGEEEEKVEKTWRKNLKNPKIEGLKQQGVGLVRKGSIHSDVSPLSKKLFKGFSVSWLFCLMFFCLMFFLFYVYVL